MERELIQEKCIEIYREYRYSSTEKKKLESIDKKEYEYMLIRERQVKKELSSNNRQIFHEKYHKCQDRRDKK